MVAIAHRLSTIAAMDRLLVLDRGRVVEEGDHKSLLARDGLYARLWAHQSGGFLGDEADEAAIEVEQPGSEAAIVEEIDREAVGAQRASLRAAVTTCRPAPTRSRADPPRTRHTALAPRGGARAQRDRVPQLLDRHHAVLPLPADRPRMTYSRARREIEHRGVSRVLRCIGTKAHPSPTRQRDADDNAVDRLVAMPADRRPRAVLADQRMDEGGGRDPESSVATLSRSETRNGGMVRW